jgi:outer membrane protein assembly factor BamB
MLLSCGGGSSTTTTTNGGPGFSLRSITISDGPPFVPTPTATATGSGSPTPSKTPKPTKTATPTLTARPASTTTFVATTAPHSTPSPVEFNSIGTFQKGNKIKLEDITQNQFTFWTSTDSTVLLAPAPGPNGGSYLTGFAGCVCILASSSGVSSLPVGVGVGVTELEGCPMCATPVPTITPTPKPAKAAAAVSTPALSARSAGVLMWGFDAGAELRGRIAPGADGSIYFITRDGLLHGLDSSGKETLRRAADGMSPAVLSNGTVIAMLSKSELAAFAPDGATRWHLEIGKSAGPVAVSDRAIYASSGADLVSVSSAGSLNWRVNVGPISAAATTPDGVVVGTPGGAVTALASDGAVVWSFTPAGGFSGTVAYADEVVYAGSASGALYAIDLRTGGPLWHVGSAHAVVAGPAVAPSGTIFIGSDMAYGVASNGQLRWKNAGLKPGSAGLCPVGSDSVFESADGDLGALLDGDGSFVWTSRSFGKIVTMATSPAGTLYVGTSTGRIFAVR